MAFSEQLPPDPEEKISKTTLEIMNSHNFLIVFLFEQIRVRKQCRNKET